MRQLSFIQSLNLFWSVIIFTITLPLVSFADDFPIKSENVSNPSTDYFKLALTIHPKAQKGDKVSQFHLYQLLDNCLGLRGNIELVEFELHHRKQVDVGAQQKYLSILGSELDKCAGISTIDSQQSFYQKDIFEWLKVSAENHYPPAMTLYSIMSIFLLKYSDENTAIYATSLDKKHSYQMLIKSLQTKHNESYFYLSQAAGLLTEQDQAAWALLAQRKGYSLTGSLAISWQIRTALLCLEKEKISHCYNKLDFTSLIRALLNNNEQAFQMAQKRSVEIEKHLNDHNYYGIGFDDVIKKYKLR